MKSDHYMMILLIKEMLVSEWKSTYQFSYFQKISFLIKTPKLHFTAGFGPYSSRSAANPN
jgi:hypothetical protein